MSLKLKLAAVLLLALFSSRAALSGSDGIVWQLNSEDGTLTLAIKNELPLEQVLGNLAAEMQFELELGQPHYPLVSGEFSGSVQEVLNKLARPASIIISTQEQSPYQLQRVELLPTGDEDSQFLNDGKQSSAQKLLDKSNLSPAKRKAMERRLDRGE